MKRLQRLRVAFLASVRESMACEAGALVEHRQLSVSTRLELRQREMARRRLIMAPAAIIGNVAEGTILAIERCILPVDIVFPSRRVRNRHHHLMAGNAFLIARGGWCDV